MRRGSGVKLPSIGWLLMGCMVVMAVVWLSDIRLPTHRPVTNASAATRDAVKGKVVDLLDRPAVQVSHPERDVLLDICRIDGRLVAVGERGIIVLSDDGQSWRQATDVPASVSLTTVTFVSKDQGWAAGHSGVVLHTRDGGETWTRQLDGIVVGNLALAAAQTYSDQAGPDDSSAAERHLADARQLIDDGTDKPFLDICFKNEREGVAAGAYGLLFHTGDGGETWESWMTRIDNSEGFHYYTIQWSGDTIVMAGEQGLFYRSRDGGKSFLEIDTPYRGSYFTSAVTGAGDLIIAGLRGNAFVSSDWGETFLAMEGAPPISLLAARTARDGTVLLVNQAGMVMNTSKSRPHCLFRVDVPRLVAMVGSLVQLDNDDFLGVGNKGLIRIPLSGITTAKTGDKS
ncbi:MAG: YCF48-related protein [Pseudomonadota bacterium]